MQVSCGIRILYCAAIEAYFSYIDDQQVHNFIAVQILKNTICIHVEV